MLRLSNYSTYSVSMNLIEGWYGVIITVDGSGIEEEG
jgi:hypothetical protein